MPIERELIYQRMESFGEWLNQLIAHSGLTMRGFATRVHRSHTLISRVIKGAWTPPPDDLPKWAFILGLKGENADRFIELGRSVRAKGKKDSADYINELETNVEILKRTIQTTQVFVSGLLQVLTQKQIELPKDLTLALRKIDDDLRALD